MNGTVANLLRGAGVLVGLALTVLVLGWAAAADLLEFVAPVLALVLITLFRALGPQPERAAWAAFIVLLGVTYLSPEIGGSFELELVALIVLWALAAAGCFVSPVFLAVAFALHIPWDFIPRDLPELLRGLPVACLSFDAIVAAYIAWQAWAGRWSETSPD